jgi:hypothetical protein
VLGHFEFGFHNDVPGEWEYTTLLRDPVERLISHYYFVRNYPEHYLYPLVHGQQMTLKDYVLSGVSPELDNGQVKAVSGLYTPTGQCTEEHLESAKQNIQKYFPVAGTTEKFDESILLMKRRYGWAAPHYTRQNETASRPKRDEVSQETIDVIREVNRLDVALFDYVSKRLDRQIADEPGFQHELRRFRKVNRNWPELTAWQRFKWKVRQTVGLD